MSIALWAGVECSVVRVGDRYVDQVHATGHASRIDDLARLADLGVKAVRYPILWERTAPDGLEHADWSFADERLGRLAELGIEPIVGLVHHGSGPRWTSLLDSSFVTGLARFAAAVARRYPWVTAFTPINEPLTTARFSGLYGHWYPHARSGAAFARALLVECEATRAAMEAIREVTPRARLVQTEDIGTVYSTPSLRYQARFENRRRFLSLDLLTGRVGRRHPLRRYLEQNATPASALDSLVARPCPPDLIGVNYYVTSDRFLDDRIASYPAAARGGNGHHAYADVEAVRVRAGGILGHRSLLAILWKRYRTPLAITEAHLGCAPEEQIRWLDEAWSAAEEAQRSGADVRAVTAWSAFGAYDWDSLLTRARGHYEPGLFDVRGGAARPTALASVVKDLAERGRSDHPLAAAEGWWHRPSRLHYPTYGRRAAAARAAPARLPLRPLLITGATGVVGRAILRAAERRGIRAVALARAELDIADARSTAAALDAVEPWAVVNAAGYAHRHRAELERDTCLRENVVGVAILAAACRKRGLRLLTFSSDRVFGEEGPALHVESDATSPQGIYATSKVDAERVVSELCPEAAVVRAGPLFGLDDDADPLRIALERLLRRGCVHATSDHPASPTYLPDLADAVITLLVDGASGIWHLANSGAPLSTPELVTAAGARAGLDTSRVLGCPGRSSDSLASTGLTSERGALMPSLEDALDRYVASAASVLRSVG